MLPLEGQALLALALLAAAALGIGLRLLDALGAPEALGPLGRVACAMLLGQALIANLGLLLALAGWFTRPVVWVGVVGLALRDAPFEPEARAVRTGPQSWVVVRD